jgi:cytidylate kinase
MIITIDGPSGTGKSTVAKLVAEKLNLTFFDTGAMYRSVTWYFLKNGVDLEREESVRTALDFFHYSSSKVNGEDRHFVDKEDVSQVIRAQEITASVSAVSTYPLVREAIWAIQKESGEKQSAVFEGRDMGSTVFPKAELKVFLNADLKERGKRRLEELRKKWPEQAKQFDSQSMQEELNRRDNLDKTRTLAPLVCPKGALEIDTTSLTISEVVDQIVEAYRIRLKKLFPAYIKSKLMRPLYRMVLCVATGILRLLYRHEVFGLEHYVKRAAIIAPNHTSFWDPPLVAVSWPEEVHFLARESLFRNRLFGGFIRKLNTHPVSGDVGDITIFKTIIELLKGGKQLILFPEGERTQGELGDIKPGTGMLSMRTGAAVIPTYIDGASKIWGKKRKFPKLFGKTAVVFGKPILAESFVYLSKKEAHLAISNQLRTSILNLKQWYEKGAEGIPP